MTLNDLLCADVFFFSGLHHYECIAPLVANSLQSGRFWARSTASVHDSPWDTRSFCTVFIQVIHGPGGLYHYTEGEEVKICFASTLLSIRVLLLLSCAKSHMLSASRRQPHLLHVSAVDRRQTWSMDKS